MAKKDESIYLNIMLQTKHLLDALELVSVDPRYKQRIKHYGKGLYAELDKVFGRWLHAMDKDAEDTYFYCVKVSEQFNRIMNRQSIDMKKMALLSAILDQYEKGEIMQTDEQSVKMINSIKPDAVKKADE